MKKLKLALFDSRGNEIWFRHINPDSNNSKEFIAKTMSLNTALIEALASYVIAIKSGRPFADVLRETTAMLDNLEGSLKK